jgi:uncharacterized membrane protein
MDGFFFLVGCLLLAFPILAIVALVKTVGLGARLANLERRLGAIENQPPAAPVVAPRPIPTTPPPIPAAPLATAPEPIAAAAGPEPVAATSSPGPKERPATAVPPMPPPSTPAPTQPGISFEERLGTQWTVWVGGIALAFGGFFLVRYSIEQGYFGPGMRVFLGALLAVALIAAGEWARRSEKLSGITGLPTAHIPSILTAAGTAVAYADVYAAYALYSFLGAATAFVLLGAVALATLAAALLHGPALAGLGLVGAYVTPLIVASNQPNYWALYIYLAVVTAAAFALARARLWRWLALTAIVFAFLWTLPGIEDIRVDWLTPHAFHVLIGFVLAATLIVSGFLFGPDGESGRIDGLSSAALAVPLLGAAILVLASRHDTLALTTFVALVAATIGIAWRAEAAVGAVPAAAVLVTLVFLQYAVNINFDTLVLSSGTTADAIPEPQQVQYVSHLVLGAGFAALFGGAGFLAQGRSQHPAVSMAWAASAVFTPIAILIALYYRLYGFERSLPFAALALLMAALFSLATETLIRREQRVGTAAASGIFATGAVATLALAFTMAMEKGWLTIGLALMVPGIAWVSDKRPLPALRTLTAVIVAVVLARIFWEPRIVGSNVGTTPIFNWLLYGYGIPAAAFWLGGNLLRRRADDPPARLADSAALMFTMLLVFLEIRHYMTGGNLYRNTAPLAEMGLHVCAALVMAIGLERLRERTKSRIHDAGAQIIAMLALVGIVLGLAILDNPVFTGEAVGGRYINLILLAYALPAVLAAALALATRGRRPQAYSASFAAAAVALALAYLTLEVRRLYHGPVLSLGFTSDAEQYTYSAVWLAFGVALLAVGIFLQSQAVRFASAAVVVLTVFKVFFIDMHDLTGIYQALSLIGLGIVLIGIGWFYQRLLFPRRALPAAATS